METLSTTKTRYKLFANGISGSTLKIIAIVSMTFDHAGVILLEKLMQVRGFADIATATQFDTFIEMNQLLFSTYTLLRIIGRLAFPIFCFLIVQGFIHTHNTKKYQLRILLFALLSEIPFDLSFFQSLFYWEYQNIFFTLFFGILSMHCIKIAIDKKEWHILIRVLLGSLSVGACLFAASIFKCDYGVYGVLTIILMYLFREWKLLSVGLGCFALGSIPPFLSLIPIYYYNGEKGINMKWLFYWFYPVHILLFYLLSYFIN